MNPLDFFTIVEATRDVLNPISPAKLERVAGYAGVRAGTHVLDVGSGKGAMLRQWAAQHNLRGVGLEVNPAFVADARRHAEAEGVAHRLTFIEGPALAWVPDPAGHDVVTCIGATFALGGFGAALGWMAARLRPGGALAVGDVYWRPESGVDRDGWTDLPDLAGRHAAFTAARLEVVGFVAADGADWDHYTSLMWGAAHAWAAAHPGHPHHAEVRRIVREGRERYFSFERAGLGWGIWVAQSALP